MTIDENQTATFSPELLEVSAEGATDAATRTGERAADLVEAWVRGKNAAAVAALANDEKAPALARKAARRGLAVLKARGVPIPDRARVARVGGDAVEEQLAWFIAPDAAATCAILLARRWKSGRHEVLRVPFRDGVGLLQIQALQASGTQLRALLTELGQTFGFEPVPVPLEWARWRLAAARAAHARSGAIVPLGVDTHAELLGPVPAEPPPHPIDAAKLELPDSATAAARSSELHMEPEFAGWMPGGGAVQELLVDVGRRASAVPADSSDRFDVALRDALDSATDRFFTVEAREQVATLMKDAAISVLARRGRDVAATVMAVAAAIRAAGLITDPPHELPFLRAFFQKALGFIASKNGGQLPIPMMAGEAGAEGPAGEATPAEVEASSTIVSPAEVAQEKALPGEKVSPGGIILP
jgi:hypothetical protein